MECPHCGVLNPMTNKFCRECGGSLEAGSQQLSSGSDPSILVGRFPAVGDAPASLGSRPDDSWEDSFWGPPPEAVPAPRSRFSFVSRIWEAVSTHRLLAGAVAAGAAGITGLVLLALLLASPAPNATVSSAGGVDYLSLARTRLASGQYESAIQMLQVALQQNPHDAAATALLDEARRQSATRTPAVQPQQQTTDPAVVSTMERMFGGSLASTASLPAAPKYSRATGYSSGALRQGQLVGGPIEAAVPPPLLGEYSLEPTSAGWGITAGEPVPAIPQMPFAARSWLVPPGRTPPRGLAVVELNPAGSPATGQSAQAVVPLSQRPATEPLPAGSVQVQSGATGPAAGSSGGAKRGGSSAPTLTVRPATNFLGQARMQQAKAQQLRRENRLEAARAQYRAAIESCQAAIDAGELKQEAESIRIACEAALRSLQF